MRYRLVIFDFDGTLADSFPWFLGAVNRAAARFGFRPVPAADHERLRGYDARRIIEHLGLPLWKAPLVAGYMRREMSREIGQISLFPGVDQVLEGLSRSGTRIAIVTSNSEENVRVVLGARNASLVQHLECGASLFGKRRALRRVLAASAVRAADAICIGDEVRDLQAARAEGIPFGAVGWGYTRADALLRHAPREAFSRMEEILEKLA